MEETLDQASLSIVSRRNDVAANLLYFWRRLMPELGSVATAKNDEVASNLVLRRLEDRIPELDRHLGRKTLEAEILHESEARS